MIIYDYNIESGKKYNNRCKITGLSKGCQGYIFYKFFQFLYLNEECIHIILEYYFHFYFIYKNIQNL